jgi:hypothetical protein
MRSQSFSLMLFLRGSSLRCLIRETSYYSGVGSLEAQSPARSPTLTLVSTRIPRLSPMLILKTTWQWFSNLRLIQMRYTFSRQHRTEEYRSQGGPPSASILEIFISRWFSGDSRHLALMRWLPAWRYFCKRPSVIDTE